MRAKYPIHQIKPDSLDEIADLWGQLKRHHQQRTSNFAEHYANNTFEGRKAELLRKQQLAVYVANLDSSDKLVGFCVVSVNYEIGEIDSLFTIPEVRGQQVGHQLMECGLNWLGSQNTKHIRLMVAEGNEGVLSFYEKFGFKKRATQLEKLIDAKCD